jgi:hypothetical protein
MKTLPREGGREKHVREDPSPEEVREDIERHIEGQVDRIRKEV